MTDGFRAVFDDLHRTANQIGEAVQAVAELPWQGPSGDFGHRGVQVGWTQFLEDASAEIEKLLEKAGEHSDGLRAAAGLYQESDDEGGFVLGNIGDLLDPGDGTVGGGFTGGIKDVVDKATGNSAGIAGFMSPQRAAQLFPDGGIASRLDPDFPDAGQVGRELREGRDGAL
ncbi:hypothetical protein [Amycolatopsis taiwanensis]|uniref:hypothetical protein n=1 Tax=Amycolatopsis taiwanensis TaxID=342230 RepID=UPI0004B702F3|nr:hypothetical protein [Amycolatopsis taiwanensis]